MEIGVRETKTHLSEYLRRVQTGEEFVITDRGRAIARISPIHATPDISPGLARGISEGWIRQPSSFGPLPPVDPARGALPAGVTTEDLIDEDRGDY